MASKLIRIGSGSDELRQPKSRKSQPSATEIEADPDSIVLTKRAVAEIQRQLAERNTPGSALRVGLRGGGCSGFSYVFDWDDRQARETDAVIDQGGVRVFVDPKSLKLLKGSILDYRTSLMNRGFAFYNPNAKSSCGCGQSVTF